jgi:hypothetical protein
MSAGTQLSMNPNLLLKKNYQIDGGGQFQQQPRLTPIGDPANAFNIDAANAQCSVDFTYLRGINFIRVNPSAEKPYRFLPFVPDGVTCLQLDAGAQLVLTGPLSGCHIYVAQQGANTILLHSNSNSTAATPALNTENKLAFAQGALRAHYPGAAITNTLVYNPAPRAVDYFGYLGFVLGCKPKFGISLKKQSWTGSTGATDWRFYVYGVNAAGNILREF